MLKIEVSKHQEKEYFDLINGSQSGHKYIKPIKALKKLRADEYKCGQFEYYFLTFLIRNYKKIILMSPTKIENWIKRIDGCCKNKFYITKTNVSGQGSITYDQTCFGKRLEKALGYSKLQQKILKKYFHSYGMKTCTYCNSQYTLTFKNKKIESVKFQIDHIFPKKKYPYFSISLYNLIPSCANCNLNKGDRDFWIKDYCHPYLESLSDRFKFTLTRSSDEYLYSKTEEIDFNDIDISITNCSSDQKVNNHNDMFDIEGIHSNFSEIAKEILALGFQYNESKRYELLNSLKGENGELMFSDKETIDRIFLRVYPNKIDMHNRPLSKFIQDIARFSDFYDDK